jgi:hypothetical protein
MKSFSRLQILDDKILVVYRTRLDLEIRRKLELEVYVFHLPKGLDAKINHTSITSHRKVMRNLT